MPPDRASTRVGTAVTHPVGYPLITDNDNLILDCLFADAFDAKRLEREIKRIPGVVESGLFVDMTDRLVVGKAEGDPEVIDAV